MARRKALTGSAMKGLTFCVMSLIGTYNRKECCSAASVPPKNSHLTTALRPPVTVPKRTDVPTSGPPSRAAGGLGRGAPVPRIL